MSAGRLAPDTPASRPFPSPVRRQPEPTEERCNESSRKHCCFSWPGELCEAGHEKNPYAMRECSDAAIRRVRPNMPRTRFGVDGLVSIQSDDTEGRPQSGIGMAAHVPVLDGSAKSNSSLLADPVTSMTRGPLVTTTPPKMLLASDGFPSLGIPLNGWSARKGESREGNQAGGGGGHVDPERELRCLTRLRSYPRGRSPRATAVLGSRLSAQVRAQYIGNRLLSGDRDHLGV